MLKIGKVSHILITLENGQKVVRERVIIRSEKEKIFVDSHLANFAKVCFSKNCEGDFIIFVEMDETVNIANRAIVNIGDVIVEIEKLQESEFKVVKILKGGFIKAGNDVRVLSFEI